MHYRPERKTVGDLLSMTTPPVVVPDWQRNYSWTDSEVDTFWRDIMQFNDRYPGENVAQQEYFLGSVVIVEGSNVHLLLDGQQRLATSAILLSVLRDFLLRYNRDAAVRLSHRYLTDYDDAEARYVFKVTLNRYDRDFFMREVLEFRETSYDPPLPTLESHRLIRKTREFFTGKLEAYFASSASPTLSHQWALRIQRIITGHVSVVAVFSGDEDNAAIVFETLNDRGIGLSTPDLLRNLLLRRAPEGEREEIIDLWGEILEMEDEFSLKAFLRHYWISHHGDVKTQSLYREIKGNILAGNRNSREFSRDLSGAAAIYREVIGADHANEEIARLLKALNELEASLFYPAALSALQVEENPDLLRLFFSSLVTCYVRHSTVGRLETSILEDFGFGLAKRIRTNGDISAAIADVKTIAPNDVSFQDAFGRVSIAKMSTARYLLRALEHYYRQTQELEVSTPSRVHVEHVYPQTPQLGHRWANHQQAVNRLGNLTLLCRKLNTSIKNATFDVKKPHLARSELVLTQQVVSFDHWDMETLECRQLNMAAVAPSIWTL
jgi:hypothetical protein